MVNHAGMAFPPPMTTPGVIDFFQREIIPAFSVAPVLDSLPKVPSPRYSERKATTPCYKPLLVPPPMKYYTVEWYDTSYLDSVMNGSSDESEGDEDRDGASGIARVISIVGAAISGFVCGALFSILDNKELLKTSMGDFNKTIDRWKENETPDDNVLKAVAIVENIFKKQKLELNAKLTVAVTFFGAGIFTIASLVTRSKFANWSTIVCLSFATLASIGIYINKRAFIKQIEKDALEIENLIKK